MHDWKKDGGKFLLCQGFGEFCWKSFLQRTKKTTKYDPRTFNGREQNLNRIIILVNRLLLLPKNCDTKTSGIHQQNYRCTGGKSEYISCILKYYIAYFIFFKFISPSSCPTYVYNLPDFIFTPCQPPPPSPPPTPPRTPMSKLINFQLIIYFLRLLSVLCLKSDFMFIAVI